MKEPLNLNTLKALDTEERELTLRTLIVDVHDWLHTANERDGGTPIWEYSSTRSYLIDVIAAIKQLDLSKDLLLDATAVLRLSERAVGKAVRRGQAAGELSSLSTNPQTRKGEPKLPSPYPYIGSGTVAHVIYKMTDGVSDAMFASVVKEAREEGAPTRNNIVRKIAALKAGKKADSRPDLVDTSRQLGEQLRRITLRLRSLRDDDRLERNKAEVAARMRPYLADAEEICAALRKTLDAQNRDEGK